MIRVLRPAVPLLAVTAFLISACDYGVSADNESPARQQRGYVIPYGMPPGADAIDFESVDSAPLRQHYALLRSQTIALLEKPVAVEQKSLLIRMLLEDNSASPVSPFVEQFAAHRMLLQLLDDSKSEIQSIAFYAQLLIDNHNPDAEIIYRALDRLKSRWSEAKIREAGLLTINRAAEWAERVCVDCYDSSSAKRAGNIGVASKRQAVLRAVDNLSRLAGP